ncbi:MAG: hypothetical protein MSH10_00495 [Pygmaiobacter massiliensis]|nr:hypothetical protein [Pygmaiobacter massiliensis]
MILKNYFKSKETLKDFSVNWLYSIWSRLFGIAMIFTVLLLLFVDKNMDFQKRTPNDLLLSNWQLVPWVVLLLVSFGFLCGTKRFGNGKTQIQASFYKVLSFYFVVVLILQLIVGRSIWFYTGWDVEIVTHTAQTLADFGMRQAMDENSWYYSIYPNNVFLTLILSFLFKAGNVFFSAQPYCMLVLASILSVWISCYLGALCIYRLTESVPVTAFAVALETVLIAFSGWIVIPYTDTFGMLFPAVALACIVFIRHKAWQAAAVTGITGIGSLIKPTILIFWIAYVIVCTINWLKHLQMKEKNKKQILCCVGAIIVAFAGVLAIKSYNPMEYYLNKEASLSITHYLMMGANEGWDGGYCQEDVDFSNEHLDRADRQKQNIEVFKARLKEMGPAGTVNLLLRKHLLNYNNGQFAWGYEGNFYKTENENTDALAVFLQQTYYRIWQDPKGQVFALIQQVVWLTVLVGATGLAFGNNKQKYWSQVETVALTLLGITMFLLIFECRSRYLYLFTPLFVCMFAVGMQRWCAFFSCCIFKKKRCGET